jgi:hypothetical protein
MVLRMRFLATPPGDARTRRNLRKRENRGIFAITNPSTMSFQKMDHHGDHPKDVGISSMTSPHSMASYISSVGEVNNEDKKSL